MRFDKDVSLYLDRLPTSDREVLPGLVSRLRVAHTSSHRVDLSATIDAGGFSRAPCRGRWPGRNDAAV